MRLQGARVLLAGGSRGIGAALAGGLVDAGATLALVARSVLPHMLDRGRGQVVNISSMAAVIAPPGLAAYGASKAGLSHFTAGLRADLRDDPIALTLVHLGSVATDLDAQSRSYGPLRQLAERSGGRDVVPMEQVVPRLVRAITREEAEVRGPAAMAPLAGMANLPRRVGRMLFRGAPARPGAP